MKYAKLITPAATPSSLKDLCDVTDNFGAGFVIIQAAAGNAANINFGTKDAQPAFLLPNGSAELRLTNLKDIHVVGNGTDTLSVVVL